MNALLIYARLRLEFLIAVHATVAAGWGRSLGLGEFHYKGFSGEKETGNRGRILQCRARYLGRVDDPSFYDGRRNREP